MPKQLFMEAKRFSLVKKAIEIFKEFVHTEVRSSAHRTPLKHARLLWTPKNGIDDNRLCEPLILPEFLLQTAFCR